MTSVLAQERALYEEVWQHDQYAAFSPGVEYLPLFLDMAGRGRGSVLDAGTGAGAGALALRAAGFAVCACDVTDAGRTTPAAQALPFVRATIWHDLASVAYLAHVTDRDRFTPTAFDWVYCTDVLEHLPEAFTMLAVVRMLEVARRGVFLSVAFEPDQYGALVGRALHQTVRPFEWWKAQLAEVGTVVEARDLLASGVFLVTQR